MTPRTQIEKLWVAGAGLLALLIVVIGWFFLISPQRGETDDVAGQTSTAQTANEGLQAKIVTLTAESKKIGTYQKALAAAQAALPSTSGAPAFLRSMQSIAHASSTRLTSVTINPAQAWNAPATTATGPTSPSSSASSSSSSSTTAGTPGAANVSATGVYEIPLTATVSGSPAQVSVFLGQLQEVQPRAVLITGLTRGGQNPGAVTAGSVAARMTTLTLTMDMFVMPAAAAAPAPATPTTGG